MENFIAFLKSSKALLKTARHIHLTLGNESCDLDSSISALILAFCLSSSKKQCEKIFVPILNVTREEFTLRTENCFVLQQAGVSLDDLVYRNELNLASITAQHTVSVSMVDHHILSKNDHILAPYVTQIFDHRPLDTSYHWDPTKVHIRIEQIGSCCTLIADEIMKANERILTKPLAYLLYQVIVYDTIALKPENHKAKPLDISTAVKLEQKYGFHEDRQVLFDKLWEIHNDVSALTPKQLLKKDMKLIEGVYIPGLPMLVETYLNLEESLEAVEEFAREHQVSCLILIGLNASNLEVKRDLAVFSVSADDRLRKILLDTLKSSEEYNFQFEERETKFGSKFSLLHVHNTKLSRKQLVPLVKQAWKSYVKKQ